MLPAVGEVVNLGLSNGDVYKGEMRDGRPNGRGVYTWADGSTYSGEWFDGLKQGRGNYVYANGDMYEGGYHQGVKHGYGAASWSNGSRYVGQWHAGREHGQGRYTTGDGQCYTGTFNQGFVDGEGVHTWEDGSAFHCTHSRGVAVSQGIYIPAEASGKLDLPNTTVGSPLPSSLQSIAPVQERSLPASKGDQRPGLLPPVSMENLAPSAPTNYGTPLVQLFNGMVQLPNGMIGYLVQVPVAEPAVSPRTLSSRSHNGETGSKQRSSSRSSSAEKGRRKGHSLRSKSPSKAADPSKSADPPKNSRAAPVMQHNLQQTLPAQRPQSPEMGIPGQRWVPIYPLPKTQQPSSGSSAGKTQPPSGPQSSTSLQPSYYSTLGDPGRFSSTTPRQL